MLLLDNFNHSAPFRFCYRVIKPKFLYMIESNSNVTCLGGDLTAPDFAVRTREKPV